jgi:hypothetical protein
MTKKREKLHQLGQVPECSQAVVLAEAHPQIHPVGEVLSGEAEVLAGEAQAEVGDKNVVCFIF